VEEDESRRKKSLPPYPDQFANRSEFGATGIKWGTGEDAALSRMRGLTREELQSMGVTRDMAQRWADFYKNVVVLHPENESARGRTVLMQFAADLLSEEP
jgi:hypothetical protein